MQEQEPHLNLNASIEYTRSLWLDSSNNFDKFPYPHYYLRLSALCDREGRSDCPIRMFVCFLVVYIDSYYYNTSPDYTFVANLFSGLQIPRPPHSGDRYYQ